MTKACCIAIILAVVTMTGCAVDSMEDQELEPDVGTIESEIGGSVWLNMMGQPGGLWKWQICNTYGSTAYRRVVYEDYAVHGCRAIQAKNCTIPDRTVVKPHSLINC
jgi:hypothetical protein